MMRSMSCRVSFGGLRASLLYACCLLPQFLLPAVAQSQAPYPNQPIKAIAMFPAGTGADVRIRYYAKKLSEIAGQPGVVENKPGAFGNIDGVESDGKGGYVISDYLAGKVMRVNAAGEGSVIQQFKPGAADIGLALAKGVLLVPHMNENQIGAYDISAALQ